MLWKIVPQSPHAPVHQMLLQVYHFILGCRLTIAALTSSGRLQFLQHSQLKPTPMPSAGCISLMCSPWFCRQVMVERPGCWSLHLAGSLPSLALCQNRVLGLPHPMRARLCLMRHQHWLACPPRPSRSLSIQLPPAVRMRRPAPRLARPAWPPRTPDALLPCTDPVRRPQLWQWCSSLRSAAQRTLLGRRQPTQQAPPRVMSVLGMGGCVPGVARQVGKHCARMICHSDVTDSSCAAGTAVQTKASVLSGAGLIALLSSSRSLLKLSLLKQRDGRNTS